MGVMKKSTKKGLAAVLCFVVAHHAFGQDPWVWDKEVWGAETNGVRAGLEILHRSEATNLVPVYVVPVLL
jgi:hypothetical protein